MVLGVDMCGDHGTGTKRVTVVNYQNHRKLPNGARVTRDVAGKQFLVSHLTIFRGDSDQNKRDVNHDSIVHFPPEFGYYSCILWGSA